MSARISTPGDAPTPRETQVAIALLFGRSAKHTARDLGMSLKTVLAHRAHLYLKFGAHSAAELVTILLTRKPEG